MLQLCTVKFRSCYVSKSQVCTYGGNCTQTLLSARASSRRSRLQGQSDASGGLEAQAQGEPREGANINSGLQQGGRGCSSRLLANIPGEVGAAENQGRATKRTDAHTSAALK